MGGCISTSSLHTLHTCERESTPKWTLSGREQPGKVLNIVDGDTVDIAIELHPNQFFQFRVRLYGIDTPEKRPLKSSPNREAEIAASKRSTEALTQYLMKYDFLIHKVVFREADKYGRWLCTFHFDDVPVSVNDWMVQEGFAKSYFGGTKEKFEENII